MRARKKKNTVPRLERCAAVLTDKILPSEKPVHIEIGCGKGQFITSMASSEADADFYALEKVPDVVVMAAEKAMAAELVNVKFLIADAMSLTEICQPGTADVIYLNFSDPWPKNKDFYKRLTYRNFLEIYKKILKPDGVLKLKTDNERLFDFSAAELNYSGFEIFESTRDLYMSGIENKFRTEYETRFVEQGLPIYHLKSRVSGKPFPAEG